MTFRERLTCYSKEQLEPGSRLFLSIVITVFVYLLILLDHEKTTFRLQFLIPAFSTFILLIYYRISDEFKDYETDKKFFPDRPIPSGRLFLSDLKVMLVTVSLTGLVLNLIYPQALYEYLAAFIFTFAMGKWFFMEKIISKNRLLAFITHAPVGIFLYWYAIKWLLNLEGLQWTLVEIMSVIGFIVLPGLSWEILRKTFLPQDEMPGYQIYSTMLGFRGSLAFAAFWVVVTELNNLLLVRLFDPLFVMDIPLLLINLTLLFVIMIHSVRPLMKNLKPVAEIYMGLHLLLPMGLLIYRYWMSHV